MTELGSTDEEEDEDDDDDELVDEVDDVELQLLEQNAAFPVLDAAFGAEDTLIVDVAFACADDDELKRSLSRLFERHLRI